MQKITPFLWFDDNAEEAVAFYTSIFEKSRTVSVSRYGDAGPGPKGRVMVMLKMVKVDIAGLKAAAEGKAGAA